MEKPPGIGRGTTPAARFGRTPASHWPRPERLPDMDESNQRSEPSEPGAVGGAYPDPGPDVVVNAMLCHSAFVMNGQVLVKGGVRHIFAGSGSPLRVLSVGLGAHVEPPAHRAGGRHVLQVRLREIRDGEAGAPLPLAWRARQGTSRLEPMLALEYRLEYRSGGTGEPAAGGNRVRVPFAVNFTELELPWPGHYEFLLSIDGMPVRRVPFRVDQTPD
jgi:hypothetical protein